MNKKFETKDKKYSYIVYIINFYINGTSSV